MNIIVPNRKQGPEKVQSVEPSNMTIGMTWYDTSAGKMEVSNGTGLDNFEDVGGGGTPGPGSEYGFICGGYRGSIRSTIDRITFPFDSGTATHVSDLTVARYYLSANNSSDYGFICGGIDGTYLSTIDRITFPFDSGTATHVGDLTGAKNQLSANNSSNYGYICGGYTGSNLSTIDRITFPFDSGTTTHVGDLTDTRAHSSATDGTDFTMLFG